MKCLFNHNWSWPRKRGNKDMQVCLDCGMERESKVSFDGPRYHRTQEPIPDFIATPTAIHTGPERRKQRREVTPITAAAA
ncbi:MAG: hypothetical protein ACM336_19840 [Acidobacteriota bacterium]